MMNDESILFLQKHIIMCLNEISESRRNGTEKDNFLLGEIYAYMDCLQILLLNQGLDNQILLSLEEKYGI